MTTITRLDRDLLALALRQHAVVTTEHLRALGFTPAAIHHRVGTARLHRIHRGVYAVGRPDLSRHGRWLAATYACGDGALLSHTSAGLLWRILERGDERPHVTLPTRSGRRRRAGVTVHRSGTLQPMDAGERDRIAVTSPARTVFDLAAVLSARELKGAVRQAVRLGLADLAALDEQAQSRRLDRRAVALRRVLAFYIPGEELTESELEARFLELCTRHDIPLPDMQVRRGPRRLDFVWSRLRLVVETDGRRDHDGDVGRADDRARDRALIADGFTVLRFGWAEVVNDGAAVAGELRAIMDRLAGSTVERTA
jgi:very-short-patch-repair endonuclease